MLRKIHCQSSSENHAVQDGGQQWRAILSSDYPFQRFKWLQCTIFSQGNEVEWSGFKSAQRQKTKIKLKDLPFLFFWSRRKLSQWTDIEQALKQFLWNFLVETRGEWEQELQGSAFNKITLVNIYMEQSLFSGGSNPVLWFSEYFSRSKIQGMELELLGSIFSRLGEASGRGGEKWFASFVLWLYCWKSQVYIANQ